MYNRSMTTSAVFRSLRAAVGAAAIALGTPFAARAAEPVYTVTLPDKTRMVVTLARGRTPEGRRAVRVFSVPPTVAKYDAVVDATVTFVDDGSVKKVVVQSGPKANPTASHLEMERTDKGDDPARYSVNVPARSEKTAYSGRILSLTAAPATLGRQVDWKRKGPQEFLVFLDRGVPYPQYYPLTVTVDGSETLDLADGPLKARKLKYSAAFPYLPKEQQTGTLYVGPRGEIVRCDTALFLAPFKARGPLKPSVRSGERGTLEMALETPGEAYIRDRFRDAATREITNDIRDYRLSSTVLDLKGNLIEMESPWMGRKLTAKFGPGSVVSWTLEATPPAAVSVPGARAWFWPLFLMPDVWDSGRGSFASLAVGQQANGTYFPLVNGQIAGSPFVLERLEDVRAPNPAGGDVVLLRYRFTAGAVVWELYNDGARLVHAGASDGGVIARQGWDRFAARVTPPSAPAPYAASAAKP